LLVFFIPVASTSGISLICAFNIRYFLIEEVHACFQCDLASCMLLQNTWLVIINSNNEMFEHSLMILHFKVGMKMCLMSYIWVKRFWNRNTCGRGLIVSVWNWLDGGLLLA